MTLHCLFVLSNGVTETEILMPERAQPVVRHASRVTMAIKTALAQLEDVGQKGSKLWIAIDAEIKRQESNVSTRSGQEATA